ncbi:MAG: hypothetical protein GY847_18255, partial [Proteobacteria bacterium]|nr:hypothetical protein [Pseudomonadota bacterium]
MFRCLCSKGIVFFVVFLFVVVGCSTSTDTVEGGKSSGVEGSVESSNNEQILIKFDVPEPSVVETDLMVNGKTAHEILMEGTESPSRAGEPVMPEISTRFIIPPEHSIDDIEVIREELTQIPGEFNVIYGEVHVPLSNPIESIKKPHATPKSRIYESDDGFPADSHRLLS